MPQFLGDPHNYTHVSTWSTTYYTTSPADRMKYPWINHQPCTTAYQTMCEIPKSYYSCPPTPPPTPPPSPYSTGLCLPANSATWYCPVNGTQCYYYNATTAAYAVHKSNCQRMGGYLVSYNTGPHLLVSSSSPAGRAPFCAQPHAACAIPARVAFVTLLDGWPCFIIRPCVCCCPAAEEQRIVEKQLPTATSAGYYLGIEEISNGTFVLLDGTFIGNTTPSNSNPYKHWCDPAHALARVVLQAARSQRQCGHQPPFLKRCAL